MDNIGAVQATLRKNLSCPSLFPADKGVEVGPCQDRNGVLCLIVFGEPEAAIHVSRLIGKLRKEDNLPVSGFSYVREIFGYKIPEGKEAWEISFREL